ncbi:conserved membrane protein, unknown function [Hepatocystis sp. ex Piliocolobus tephrosceles]|nr:conserved membrane protein, unknown function [Hepatocystis sp. ex Piliocolobus tephrosceles]
MKNSLISKILTEAEITELGLHSSLLKPCSCPFILNKKHYVKICKLYLLNIVLFFSVYITVCVILLINSKKELNKAIELIIYIYLFVYFYIGLIISNNIKYYLVTKYNVKEVRKRLYTTHLRRTKKNRDKKKKEKKKKINTEEVISINNENTRTLKKDKTINKKNEYIYKEYKTLTGKLFSKEKYYLVNNIEENQFELNNNNIVPEQKYYLLNDLKNINEDINNELLKYIQYENNNYTINNNKYDKFLIIAGVINQLNIFVDIIFLFYLYDYNIYMLYACLCVCAYYLIHFFIIIKYTIIIIKSLIWIYKKQFFKFYKNTVSQWKWAYSYYTTKTRKTIKRFITSFIKLKKNKRISSNEIEPNIFLNKYTSYNSWNFLCIESKTHYWEENWLQNLYNSDLYNLQEIKIKKNKLKRSNITNNNLKYDNIKNNNINTNNIKNSMSNRTNDKKMDKHGIKIKNKIIYERALLPSYVQMIANLSSFLSFFQVLNILKIKFLSAHSFYAHASFTMLLFLLKVLSMDIVLCVFKFFCSFYSPNNLVMGLFLFISVFNIINTYIINLADNNLLDDMDIRY